MNPAESYTIALGLFPQLLGLVCLLAFGSLLVQVRGVYLKVERSYGKFSRTLRLPEGLDAGHVKANFSDGVLEIKIPQFENKRVVHNIEIK